ncbi:hypothetical protein [Salininema proteolyticum]|uniref:Uncharacterized protein n=1 Tax=Salininema proteolyticum TaxID=1607685 RepID=A0ABV8U1M9_9ACTN
MSERTASTGARNLAQSIVESVRLSFQGSARLGLAMRAAAAVFSSAGAAALLWPSYAPVAATIAFAVGAVVPRPVAVGVSALAFSGAALFATAGSEGGLPLWQGALAGFLFYAAFSAAAAVQNVRAGMLMDEAVVRDRLRHLGATALGTAAVVALSLTSGSGLSTAPAAATLAIGLSFALLAVYLIARLLRTNGRSERSADRRSE